jgi:magnesium chelatase subunit D
MTTRLPFSAVVGQDDAKFALLLAAVEPRLGGVLLRGDKGSAKTTLARGLAGLLPGDAPFVELPLGASEDRVLGALDVGYLLTHGDAKFRPGLLAAAHGGVLYVDEINLLADHLVDALLDVAVSGVNRVEREGLSHTHPARFVLVASMNPEEGELRPQLLDRFGLAVDVRAPHDVADRVLAVRRQLDADADAAHTPFADADAGLRRRIAAARHAKVGADDEILRIASTVAVTVGAEGLRADLMLVRAARASAALDGRAAATEADLRRVAEMVLTHRRRRNPLDTPGMEPDEVEAAFAAARHEAGITSSPTGAGEERHDVPVGDISARLPASQRRSAPAGTPAGRDGRAPGPRGRVLRDTPAGAPNAEGVDGRASAVALSIRRAVTADPYAPVEQADLRALEREQRSGSLVVFAVDASASMGAERRMAFTKAAVIGLLRDAYRRRGRVALVTFAGDDAAVVLRPTGSVEIAKARLAAVRTGGATPLAAGIDTALQVASAARGGYETCTVVLVTDGRATSGPDPVGDTQHAALRLAEADVDAVVVDAESGGARLGLARDLAERAGATYIPLERFESAECGPVQIEQLLGVSL